MFFSLLAAPMLFSPQGSFDPDPEDLGDRWVVVFNSAWPDEDGNGLNDSEEVARHWAKRRGVPLDRLIGVDCSNGTSDLYSGQSGWEDFWDEMVLPLRTQVVDDSNDRVLGFLLVYGVPMRLSPPSYGTRALDTTLMNLWDMGDRATPSFTTYGHADVYFDSAPTSGVDPGRFDPAVHRFAGRRTYLVARLDGLTKDHAMEMVDSALYGDVYLSNQPGHYTGGAYCDTRYGAYTSGDLAGYPFSHVFYDTADKDMAYGRDWMEQAGFALKWEPYGTEIGEPSAQWEDGTPALTVSDAMMYEGWYNYNTYHDVWTWMVGSMACDLNSNSVARLREEDPGTFLSSALHLGLTCGTGVVAEPYLNGHPYPEVFAYYMIEGYPFAEAARVSDPKARWRNLYLGDPLYQPFRVGKTPQLDQDAPPACQVLHASASAVPGDWDLETFLDTTDAMPDLGTLSVAFGEDPTFGSLATGSDDRPRLFHTTQLLGLAADEVIYYRPDYTDPVGNTGTGSTFVLHTGFETRDVIATIESDTLSVPVGTPFILELAIGSTDGLGSLTSQDITLTATHLGLSQLSILSRFTSAAAEVYSSAEGNLRTIRLEVPGTIGAGTYLFEASSASAAGSDADSVTVVVF